MAYVSPCWAVSGGPFTTVAGVAAENKKKGLLRPTTGHAVGLVGGEDAGCRRRRRWILLETLLPVTGVLGRLVKLKAKRTSAMDSVPADWSALCKGRPLTIILARSQGWVGGQGPGTSIGSSQTRVWLSDATNHRPVGFWLGHPPPSLSHASLLLLPTQPIRALVVYAKLRTWANICSVGN